LRAAGGAGLRPATGFRAVAARAGFRAAAGPATFASARGVAPLPFTDPGFASTSILGFSFAFVAGGTRVAFAFPFGVDRAAAFPGPFAPFRAGRAEVRSPPTALRACSRSVDRVVFLGFMVSRSKQ
jgi:hypothetical protein